MDSNKITNSTKNIILAAPGKMQHILLPSGKKIQLIKSPEEYRKFINSHKTIQNIPTVSKTPNADLPKLTLIKQDTLMNKPLPVDIPKEPKQTTVLPPKIPCQFKIGEIINVDDEPEQKDPLAINGVKHTNSPLPKSIAGKQIYTIQQDGLYLNGVKINDFQKKLVIVNGNNAKEIGRIPPQAQLDSTLKQAVTVPTQAKEIARIPPNARTVQNLRVGVSKASSPTPTTSTPHISKQSAWTPELKNKCLENVPLAALFQLLKEKFVPLVGHACTLAIIDHLKMAFVRCHVSKIRAVRDMIQYVDNFKKYQSHKEKKLQEKCGFESVAVQTNQDSVPEPTVSRDELAPIEHLRALLYKDWSSALEPDDHGFMPIHTAVLEKNENIINRRLMILTKLNKLDVQEEKVGMTALHLAIYTNAGKATIKQLLDARCDPGVCDNDDENCVHYAVRHGNYVLLTLILKHLRNVTDINHKNKDGLTPLMLSAQLNKIKEAEVLIENFADVNTADPKSGRTVLFMAMEQNNYELCRVFLENGADVRKRCFSGVSGYEASLEIHTLNQDIRKLVHRWYTKTAKRPSNTSINGRRKKFKSDINYDSDDSLDEMISRT